MLTRIKKEWFLFEELVKRDFKRKYSRTVLGMGWSLLSPLLQLLVLRMVFMDFFGKNTPHFTTYLFCGTLVFSYFKESTGGGMNSLKDNAAIFSKINVPKYLFLFSKNVSSLINFGLTLCVFCVFVAFDHVTFTWKFLLLSYPILCLVIFNVGIGLILSALYVFFRDTSNIYEILTLLMHYLSALFYTLDDFSETARQLFLLNPVYSYIYYFRLVVIDSVVPPWQLHLLCAGYAVVALLIGCLIYHRNNHKFLYYV